MSLTRSARLAVCAVVAAWLSTGGSEADEVYQPDVKPASDEGRVAIAGFRVPRGLNVELFAAEPLLANPVAFAIDEKNRFYVAETFRLHKGVTDTRGHMNWLDEDLACRTVADRVAMYRRFLKPDEFVGYGTEHDRVRLVEDRDGDGVAETATVFADGFQGPETGLGAGLLARSGTVWYTNIPHLWALRDADGDGRADERTSLQEGYGVHVGFIGHDLHGLQLGPDGRLYFSIGDRALNVTAADGRRIEHLDSGAVLRCEPDGSGLELYATGLRNPQELAFNEWGDLFTCDNNSDGGDRARWVHLVEGGDSGWRIGYQFIERPNSRGPWNAEKLWRPRPENTAAYLLPPLANLSDGPSGLVYDPGVTALPESTRGTFFLADFRGAASTSGLRAIKLRNRGASYEVAEEKQHLWGLQATDVDFGTDGALYVSDWVQGWDLTGKGRIYRVSDPQMVGLGSVAEVRQLLADGMAGRGVAELARLLDHADQRVRREAQFELARRADDAKDPGAMEEAAAALVEAATGRGPTRARTPAVWGVGQMHRKGRRDLAPTFARLLADEDPEVRAQAARALADAGRPTAGVDGALVALLTDPEPRARFHAAIALGKLGVAGAADAVLAMLRENAGEDAYLQHAGVFYLAGLADEARLLAASRDESASVRLAALLAMRRLGSGAVAGFLGDREPGLVLEAARAIYDVTILPGLPALAALPVDARTSPFVLRRVVAANERLAGLNRDGGEARRLAELATREDLPPAVRAEALDALARWGAPLGRDRIVGLWRPGAGRPAAQAVEALTARLPGLLADAPPDVRRAASRAAAKLEIFDVGPALVALLDNAGADPETRVEALRALEGLRHAGLGEAAARAADAEDAGLRAEGLRILAVERPTEALTRLRAALQRPSLRERQNALAILGTIRGEEADALIAGLLDETLGGRVEAGLRLDVIEAAQKREAPAVQERLGRHEAARPKDDPLAAYAEALAGGDARRGKVLFWENAAVYCVRCHKMGGDGGEVGPDLTGIGGKQSREYLLESIVAPNRKIAEGYESLVLALADGQVVGGIVKGRESGRIRLMTPEGSVLTIAEDQVEESRAGVSAMPEELAGRLTKRELRDLVEFLAGSRGPGGGATGGHER